MPPLNTHAISTASAPVITRLYKIAGTPTCTVSGLAFPSDKPTGIKSQPACALIANNAGYA